MMDNREKELFEKVPVTKAVLSLAVPTVISQLIMVLYNMADTFFVGQTGDPNQVAAANLCMPMIIFLTGIANMFGIGGSSLISRCLGSGNKEKAKKVSAFCVWASAPVSIIYGIAVYVLCPVILPAFGADAETYDFCRQYLFWTVAVGSVPLVLNAVFAHLVRSEGYSGQASFGMILGTVLNILLDPIFIITLKMQIAGAALATMLSNLAAAIYFVDFIGKKRGSTVLTTDPRFFSTKERIPYADHNYDIPVDGQKNPAFAPVFPEKRRPRYSIYVHHEQTQGCLRHRMGHTNSGLWRDGHFDPSLYSCMERTGGIRYTGASRKCRMNFRVLKRFVK